jgi:hypothetical protein
MEDDDSEFVGSIPDVIDLGEKRLLRDLDLAIFRRVDSSATMTASQATVTKPVIAPPDLLIAAKGIWLTGGALTRAQFLQQRSFEYVTDYIGAADGVPKFWGEQDEVTWIFGRTPDATYTVNVRYLSRPNPLVVISNETNWLSDNAYDILFKAALAESEKFLKSDERAPMWESDYLQSIPMARRELYNQFGNQYDNLGAVAVPQGPRSTT